MEGISITSIIAPTERPFAFTTIVVHFKSDLDRVHGERSTNIYTAFGIAIATFPGFRNTVSYDRFRQDRKLWEAGRRLMLMVAIASYHLYEKPFLRT
ncbi:bestrophin family ion channel [Mucilaginibacter sp.]|uniref:bestrophin family ion channel n=1 Tax=Mucilaginibacter sp. TaxID=1882438 RepID=UPI0035691072